MRLRAQIIIDINADDYIKAADHQKRLCQFLEKIREQYPRATLSMRERRERNKMEPAEPQIANHRFLSIAKGK